MREIFFSFLTLASIKMTNNDICSLKDKNVKKERKEDKDDSFNKRQKYNQAWMIMNLQGRLILEAKMKKKKYIDFFLIATLRQCLFTAEVPQLWLDVSSRPEKPKKKSGMGPIW